MALSKRLPFHCRAEDELAQTTRFVRIFPTPETHRYFKYFQQPRYYNLLMDAWEHSYGDCRPAGIDRLERLCQGLLSCDVCI